MKVLANFLIIAIVWSCLPVSGQTGTQNDNRGVRVKSTVPTSGKRLALVVGNSTYKFTEKLNNPVNDATDMAQTLKDLGFEVIVGLDQTQKGLKSLIRQFGERLAETKAVGLFFYAGHGISSDGANYLIPVDADIQAEDEIEGASVNVSFMLNKMKEANNDFNIVVLDACRNNPFARTWRRYSPNRSFDEDKGLVRITPPSGTIIIYSTEPGSLASDGTRRNGLFTESFLKQINKPNVEFDGLVKLVARDVREKSGGKQSPWKEGLYDGEFYFAGFDGSKPIPKIASIQSETEANKLKPLPSRAATLDIVTAQAVLDRAVKAADGSMQGQIEAIESLLTRDFNFNNNSLSGISLRGANLSKGKFQKTRMHITDLSEVNAEEIDLSESGLRFANLEKANFAHAVMTGVYAPFVWGKAAKFEKAKLNKVNFFSSDLREADFSGADLREASFAFADLRGAKFDGANLTGAYFVGSILDQATFNNAILKETDFTGASADKFLLTEKQKDGACRHDPQESGWVVQLYEDGKRDSFVSSVWFEQKGYFASFSDRTLPLCTTPKIETTNDGYSNRISLDNAVAKADRKKLFEVRLKEYIKLLTANLTAARTLKGDNKQRKEWDDYMRNAVRNTKPASKAYYSDDVLLQILLKEKLIEPEKINWLWQAKKLYELGQSVGRNQNENSAEYPMRQLIFPPKVAWGDLPDDRIDLYKSWLLARADKAPRQLVVKERIVTPENADANALVISLSALNFSKYKCCGSQSGQIGIKPDGAVSPDVGYWNKFEDREQILFVFPERLDNFLIDLPIEFKGESKLEIEVDLNLEKAVKFEGEDWYKKPFKSNRLYVVPDGVRLYKDGKLLWSGKIRTNDLAIEKEIWERIKDSNNRQDFDTFLKSFPAGNFAQVARTKQEQIAWNSIRISCDKKKLKDFLNEFPNGANSVAAKSKIRQIIDFNGLLPSNLTSGTILKKTLPGGEEICYSWIPAGNFSMGASEADIIEAGKEMKRQSPYNPGNNREYFQNETPQRKVVIKQGFWMGIYEVTQLQWTTVTKTKSRYHRDNHDEYPAEGITWEEAKEFIDKLNAADVNFKYSLPTEAEWEYAARAGTTAAFAFGSTLTGAQANFSGTYGDVKEPEESADPLTRWRQYQLAEQSSPVGIYQPNRWGLYDMHGNVSEWVEDVYKETYERLGSDGAANILEYAGSTDFRVLRGGSYRSKGYAVRSMSRALMSSSQYDITGFRIVARLK